MQLRRVALTLCLLVGLGSMAHAQVLGTGVTIPAGPAAITGGTISGTTITGGTVSSTTVNAATSYSLNGTLVNAATAPTIASGFGTTPAIACNGTAACEITVGSGGTASTGVLTMPTAANGWVCSAIDQTTMSASVFLTKQTASSTTSVTLTDYSNAPTATAWAAGDKLEVFCHAR